MKRKAALLDSPENMNKIFKITVEVANGIVEMNFTDKKMCIDEYHKIKSAGVYGGQWIKKIEYDELS